MNERLYDIRVETRNRLLVDARKVALAEGGITFLFGESGIGKSLAGKALFGLLDEREYRVRMNGGGYRSYSAQPEVARARQNGFFMFQEPSSHLNPLQTIDEQLREGSLAEARDPVAPVRELWKAEDSSALTGILPVYPKPYRPSGGEKQRILGGMAFAKMDACAEHNMPGHGLFVFDEPTGSLDREARDRFLDRLFARYRRRKETILLITHDYGIIGYVQSSHRDLLPHMTFSELRLLGNVAQARAFEPQLFLQWLGSQHPHRVAQGTQAILRVSSMLRVFGRTLSFSAETGEGEDADLVVHSGELVYLKAGSGVGKTTVAKVVVGLQRAESVRMEIDGEAFDEASSRQKWQRDLWGKNMTMAFQHADEALNPHASVEETLRLLREPSLHTEEGVNSALRTLFDQAEIPQLRKRKVWQLSGGQKQRLNLLRAFALSTPLIILDEPLSALDFESIDRVLALIREAQRRNQAVLLISHNEDIFDAIVPLESVYRLSQVTS
jgi:peptide/nickel transport system ATP-binding protein